MILELVVTEETTELALGFVVTNNKNIVVETKLTL